MHGPIPARHAAVLVGVTMLWGINFVPISWALESIPPFMLAALRFLLAAFPLVLVVPRPRGAASATFFYGILVGVGQFGLLFLAIRLGAAAGLASLVIQVQVFLTIAIAAFALGDRASLAQLKGALIAGGGIVILAWASLSGGAKLPLSGLLLILAAALSWAAGNVLAKHAARARGVNAFSMVVWSSLAPVLPLLGLSYALEGGWEAYRALAVAPFLAWGSVFFMAYAATLGGYAAWNRMLEHHPAAAVTPYALLIPLAGLGSTALVLGEPLTRAEIVASAIVFAGLAVASLAPLIRPKPVPASAADRPDPRR